MPKILYLASEDWFFASHFLPLVKAARDCSLDVVVATRVNHHRQTLEAAGCRVIALPINRGRLAPFALMREIAAIAGLIRRERPDIIYCMALRMAALGGIASRLVGMRRPVLAVTGLGTLWVNEDTKSIAARAVVRWLVRRLVSGGARMVFENHDDPREFGLDPAASNITIVPGAGVNPADFSRTPEPVAPAVKFAVVSRMLRTKGIADAVAALRQARGQGAAIELHLFGNPDPTSRDSCTEAELRVWAAEPGLFWHGPTNDVAAVWRDHHAALLLTYREGLPRMLVEAAAAGRPIIATNVAGCREIVHDGVEGLLVPARQPDAAAAAMQRLAADRGLRRRMGDAAHSGFLDGFTDAHVRDKISALYKVLINETSCA
jgi:glycosyltransferase involved in cell wall biosynthesis